MRLKRLGCCILAVTLALPLMALPTDSYAAKSRFTDTSEHWAEKYINTAVDEKIITGYPDGKFLPDKAVSRAEFATMVNKALGSNSSEKLSFKDVPSSEWYYSDVAKAVAATYTAGYDDNTFRPNSPITRQEAAVMIARIIPANGKSGNLKSFPDYKSIADWAEDALSKVNGKGYIGPYDDGKVHPADQLTRAQTAKIICDILDGETIVKSGVTIDRDGTKLSGKIYSNNVTIDDFEGKATIDGCVILGNLSVKSEDPVTLTVNNSRVANVIVNSSADVTLKGDFPKVMVSGSKAHLTLSSGSIGLLTVDGKSSDITVEKGTTISTATVNAKSDFHGTGTISLMNVNADDVTYETKPKKWNIASSVDTPKKADEAAEITFSPKDGATKVKLDTKITITFKSAMKMYDGGTIGNSDIDDFVELRKGSSSGTRVSFSASINSGKTVITIKPDSNLAKNTKYYVLMDKDSVRDSDKNGNDEQSIHFTTGDDTGSVSTAFSPTNGATAVPLNTSITVTFSDDVVRYSNGATISSGDSYLKDCLIFKKDSSSGSNVSYSASINSSKKVITIKPDANLTLNQKYYVAVVGNKLKTKDDGEAVPASSVTWSTGYVTPALSDFNVTPGDTSVTAAMTPNVAGKLYAVVLDSGSAAPSAQQIAAGQTSKGTPAPAFAKNDNAAASKSVPLPAMSGLGSGKTYDIWATLYSSASGSYSTPVKKTVTTTLPVIDFSSLTIKPVVGGSVSNEDLISFSSKTANYSVTLSSSVSTVRLQAKGPSEGTIAVKGRVLSTSGSGTLNTDVDIAANSSLTIAISGNGRTSSTYTVNFVSGDDTGLKGLTINNEKQSVSGDSFLYTLKSSDVTDLTLKLDTADKYAAVDAISSDATVSPGGSNGSGHWEFGLDIPQARSSAVVQFKVTSGKASKTYVVTIIRPAAPTSEPSETPDSV
ncbi:MAG TPA: S-layer homology domain-containing protein [Bacillota bacterium]|nr:S-layer homology domain-containing protein [Bacillota bacterium]